MRPTEQGWRHEFAPLGVPTVVIAENPELLATARAAYADWMVEAPVDGPIIEIRLEIGSAPSENVGFHIAVEGSRLTLTGDEILGSADAATGRARCSVPSRLIGDPAGLAAEATDTLLTFLLTRTGRTPIHAAGIVISDRLAILAGPSGSGKSTLAFAAARRGLRIFSDDTLYVQREPRLRVWGWPRPIHLFPEDAPPQARATRLRGGKLKAVVPLSPNDFGLGPADKAVLILLDHGDRLAMTAIDSETAVAGLSRLEPGFDLLAAESAKAAEALARGGAWRLTLERDPGAAIAFLCRHFGAATPEH